MTSRGSLSDQLRKNRGALLSGVKNFPTHPSQWSEDGSDHINVSFFGKTRLGRWLNTRNAFVFQHPLLGQFRSIDNLSMFIRSANFDDRIRMMDNFNKIRSIVSDAGGLLKFTPHYKALMVHAIYIRVLLNEQLMKLVMESTLPFDCYSVNKVTELRQRFEPSSFLTAGYMEIREALKERRAPNLKRFMDRDAGVSDDLYEDIMIRLTGKYNGNSEAVIQAFEKKRWAAYDVWATNQERRSEKAKQAEAKKAEKPVIEEVGGVANGVINSTTTPATGKIGARWFNPDTGITKILVKTTDEKVWASVEELQTSCLFNTVNNTILTAKDPAEMFSDSQIYFCNITAEVCWADGWKFYNPLTGGILYPFKETAESKVTWTSNRPERFARAKKDGRVADAAETVKELSSVAVAAVAAVDESEDQVVNEEFTTEASPVLEPGEVTGAIGSSVEEIAPVLTEAASMPASEALDETVAELKDEGVSDEVLSTVAEAVEEVIAPVPPVVDTNIGEAVVDVNAALESMNAE